MNLDNYPENLTTMHLVDLRLYKNCEHARSARDAGRGPKFFVRNRYVLYPKHEVADFISKLPPTDPIIRTPEQVAREASMKKEERHVPNKNLRNYGGSYTSREATHGQSPSL